MGRYTRLVGRVNGYAEILFLSLSFLSQTANRSVSQTFSRIRPHIIGHMILVALKSRLLRGLTQEELAEKAGMHQTYIGQVERGEKNLTLTSLEKLTRSLQIPFSVLFDGLEEISDVSEDVALKCYKIVRDKDPVKQLHLYKILLEIDMIK